MADALEANEKFTQGCEIFNGDADFSAALTAAVDYRGDSTLQMNDGTVLEGFLYNRSETSVELFPKNSVSPLSLPIANIQKLIFSGDDAAKGKSWADWVKKREAGEAQP